MGFSSAMTTERKFSLFIATIIKNLLTYFQNVTKFSSRTISMSLSESNVIGLAMSSSGQVIVASTYLKKTYWTQDYGASWFLSPTQVCLLVKV